jgi:hypothetical protein
MKESTRRMRSERMMGNKLFEGHTHSEDTKRRMSKNQTGENNSGWNGGRTISAGGYVSILKPDHPFADVNGRVKEERLVMEKQIGRYLDKKEIIHHINHNKQDNRPENLQIVSSKEHGRIHHLGNKNRLGKKNSIETRQKISQSNKGRIVSPQTKQKISLGNTGKVHDEEFRNRLKLMKTGKKDSAETRKNKSIAVKLWWDKRRGIC